MRAYTIIDPLAMMIKLFAASIALNTVVCMLLNVELALQATILKNLSQFIHFLLVVYVHSLVIYHFVSGI